MSKKTLCLFLFLILAAFLAGIIKTPGAPFNLAAQDVENAPEAQAPPAPPAPQTTEAPQIAQAPRALQASVENPAAADSYLLIHRAENAPDGNTRKNLLKEALAKTPDLPPVYFRLSAASLASPPDAVYYFFEGLRAYGRNFWWLLSLSGLLAVAAAASFLLALSVTVLMRLAREFPLIRHDLRENRSHLVIFGILLLSSAFGPGFFLASLLMTLGFYFGGRDRALVYIVFLASAAVAFSILWAEGVYTASTPGLRAVVEVNESGQDALAMAALPEATSFGEAFSYGLALKRAGRPEEAADAFMKAITARKDARAYVNLAGCFALMGRKDRAVELYEQSLQVRPTAAAYFNLSQLRRADLDYSEGDKLFADAQKLDPEKVDRFVKQAENSPNMLVDEILSEKDFFNIFEETKDSAPERQFYRGAAIAVSAASLLWMAFFFIYSGKSRLRAFRCSRCGKVLCPRCEQLPAWGRMCKSCYQSLVTLEALDPKERVSRLLVIHGRQVRKNAIVRTLAFAPPGISYIYAENVLRGMLFLWLFLFFASIPALNPLFTTGLSGMKHGWLNGLSYICAGLLYLGSYMGVKNRQGRGWL